MQNQYNVLASLRAERAHIMLNLDADCRGSEVHTEDGWCGECGLPLEIGIDYGHGHGPAYCGDVMKQARVRFWAIRNAANTHDLCRKCAMVVGAALVQTPNYMKPGIDMPYEGVPR